ncbi:hypothetical protein BKA69DRAFT_1072268 [Paraphysoderma sedebokerense]|nr:hypothetical protein BKA69DRAFT_1072268 [Paraphysoderma sedebokerense]
MKMILFGFVVLAILGMVTGKENCRIVIFGGGPVGLEAARQFLLRPTPCSVAIIEKRSEPTRSQIIRLTEEGPFNGLSRFPRRMLQDMFMSEQSDSYLKRRKSAGGENLNNLVGITVLSDLEKALRKEVGKLGAIMIYAKEESKVLEDGSVSVDGRVIQSDTFDLLVCADGSNSLCRKTLFKDIEPVRFYKDDDNPNAFTMINTIPAERVPKPVKEKIISKRKLSGPPIMLRKRSLGLTDDEINHIREQVKTMNVTRAACFTSRKGQIYSALQISRDEWNRYSQFFGKSLKPYSHIGESKSLSADGIARFKNELATGLRFCGFTNADQVKTLVDESHVTGIPIKLWHQGQNGFAKIIKTEKARNVPVTLVGDAVLGVHYFSSTGVNLGFLGVDILVNVFSSFLLDVNEHKKSFDQSNEVVPTSVEDYNLFYRQIISPEESIQGIWTSKKITSVDPDYKCTESQEELKNELHDRLNLDKEFLNTCSYSALCYFNYIPPLESVEI